MIAFQSAVVFDIFSYDNGFSLTVGLDFSKGTVSEYVFEDGIRESQLDWHSMRPQTDMDIVWKFNGFKIDFRAKTVFPVALGYITDRDFFLTDANELAKFSYHDLITDKDYLFALNLSYAFDFDIFKVGIGFGGFYSNIKMETDDGYLQYPASGEVWTGNEEKDFLNGTAISYEQARYALGFSLSFEKDFSNRFSFCLSGTYYPLVKADAIDNHFLRSTQFYDSMKKGFSADINALLEWKINDMQGIYFSAGYNCFKAFGNTNVNPLGIITHNTQSAPDSCTVATECHDMTFAIGMKFKL